MNDNETILHVADLLRDAVRFRHPADGKHVECDFTFPAEWCDLVEKVLRTSAQQPVKTGILTLDVDGWCFSIRTYDGGFEVAISDDSDVRRATYVRLDAEQSETLREFLNECGAESNRHSGAVGSEKRAEQSNPGGGHEVTGSNSHDKSEQRPTTDEPTPGSATLCALPEGQSATPAIEALRTAIGAMKPFRDEASGMPRDAEKWLLVSRHFLFSEWLAIEDAFKIACEIVAAATALPSTK